MKKIWLIIIILLLVTLIAMAGTLIFTNSSIGGKAKVSQPPKNVENHIVYNTGSPFITNLKDSNGILKTDISIEVDNKKSGKILDENEAKIRDKIINILRNLTENDIKRQDVQETLKNQITGDLQSTLKIDNITNIYFNEFVVQK